MPFKRPGGTNPPQSYRSDIDGMRAIAVVAVIIGHSFEQRLPGGYLGVDVFFVISGFVITQSLLSRRDPGFGRFLGAFFVRRIKRLLPALLVCFALTCAVLLVIDRQPKTSLITGAMSLFGLANFALHAQELDYFSASVKYNAFTHTWSLGVEEQFYLLFPVLFWLTLGWDRLFTTLISILSFASLTAFILLQSAAPTAAYYMMPMRFWELGAGVVVAALVYRGLAAPAFVTTPAATTMLVVLLVAVFLIPPDVGIAGHLLAVLLTSTLLIAGAAAQRPSVILCNPLAKYTGRISYSLYLWHWPFLTFGLLAHQSIMASPYIAIGCAVLASVLSYHLVEQPVRRMHTPVPKVRYFGIALASVLAAILGVGGADAYRKSQITVSTVNPYPPPFTLLPDTILDFDPACVVDDRERRLTPETFDTCTFAPLPHGDGRMLWVMGDSHADHLQGGLVHLRERYGYGFHLVGTPGNAYPTVRPDGFASREALMDKVRTNWKTGDVVVLSRLYLERTEALPLFPEVPAWLPKVDALAVDLAAEGINMVLIGPPPMFRFADLRACKPEDRLSCSIPRDLLAPAFDRVYALLRIIAQNHENVRVFSPFDVLCPAAVPLCHPAENGIFLFRDSDHLNVAGAARVAEELHGVLLEFD